VSADRHFRNTGSCTQNATFYIAEDPGKSGVSVTYRISVLFPGDGNTKTETLASRHQGGKVVSMPSFGRKVKPFALCRRFAAC
jgi:hypothetical protein